MDPLVKASLFKHKRTTLERIEKYISAEYFTDVNLHGKLYPEKLDVEDINHWKVPGDRLSWEDWPVEKVISEKLNDFQLAKIGDKFGPSWSTHWFKIIFGIPQEWESKEVRLRFNSQSEAMIYNQRGVLLQGLTSGTSHQLRAEYTISKSWNPEENSEHQIFYIEMVASRMFGVGQGGMINPPNPDEYFTLEKVEICVFDPVIYSLYIDLQVLHGLAKSLNEDQRGYFALYAGNQMINYIIDNDMNAAKQVSKNFFNKKSGDLNLTLALIGNCHIDSAWLWPYSETKRKAARSWISTLALMEEYPEMYFACSQAQQFLWVKEKFPKVYKKMKKRISEGKFVPVGGTWVEMDGLIPSGESFTRQFLYGQKFFKEEFGKESDIFWLPDTFGYSGQMPQIVQHFGIRFFLTQKLSWNLVNKFPHHTFMWEGIDGSQILTHFPPGDSYELRVTPEEALKSEKNFQDKGRQNIVGFLYGHGDGGGGPTQDMLERARRLANVDGCPKMKHTKPIEMFEEFEMSKNNLCKWSGELYLELHNGTYTSQANTKKLNRISEDLLRKVEMLLAMVASKKLCDINEIVKKRNEIEKAWKMVLLNQFHDVLPGSSIGLVYQDSNILYKKAELILSEIRKFCLSIIEKISKESLEYSQSPQTSNALFQNSFPWALHSLYRDSKVAVETPPLSVTKLDASHNASLNAARVVEVPKVSVLALKDGSFTIENQYLKAKISKHGQILSYIDKRIVMKSGDGDIFSEKTFKFGNIFALYDDVPLFWDAWDVMDYHLETRKILNCQENENEMELVRVAENKPLYARLTWSFRFGSSFINQYIIIDAVKPYLSFFNDVDWHESHKFLKVEFDTNILSRNALYDIQFGHIERPTHRNTSWDAAKFEVCGHKWFCLAEHNRCFSVLNDSKHGMSTVDGTMSLSLLRAPKAPDENCDMESHNFNYATMSYNGAFEESKTIQSSYEFQQVDNFSHFLNLPSRPWLSNSYIADKFIITDWIKIIGDGVMLEAAKVSENSRKIPEEELSNKSAGTIEIILRFYEMYGGNSCIWLNFAFEISEAFECLGNEENIRKLDIKTCIPKDETSEVLSKNLEVGLNKLDTLSLNSENSSKSSKSCLKMSKNDFESSQSDLKYSKNGVESLENDLEISAKGLKGFETVDDERKQFVKLNFTPFNIKTIKVVIQ